MSNKHALLDIEALDISRIIHHICHSWSADEATPGPQNIKRKCSEMDCVQSTAWEVEKCDEWMCNKFVQENKRLSYMMTPGEMP